MDLSQFHFLRPWCLMLLPALWFMWWRHHIASDPLRGWRSAMEPELLGPLTIHRGGDDRWRDVGRLVVWTVALVAVAGPTWRPEPSPFADDPVPVMVLLKTSQSMQTEDLAPSRMERAQLKVVDFTNARKAQPTGLIAYSGTAHLVLPPTRDNAVIAEMAGELDPAIMPSDGDALLEALALAKRSLEEQGGSIVVFADEVSSAIQSQLQPLSRVQVTFLSVSPGTSDDSQSVQAAAKSMRADWLPIAADSSDIDKLTKRVAGAPVSVAVEGEGTRWQEAGWWLVPIIALCVLATFRRAGEPRAQRREEEVQRPSTATGAAP